MKKATLLIPTSSSYTVKKSCGRQYVSMGPLDFPKLFLIYQKSAFSFICYQHFTSCKTKLFYYKLTFHLKGVFDNL